MNVLVLNCGSSSLKFQVAALMMKGMTAHYLLHRTYAVQPGDTILVRAAAGGMGLILCRWAKALGATVVGTVSTERKAEVARSAGCDHPVVRARQSFVDVVREVTNGEGAAVVYEAIGRDTLQQSLDSLRPMGVCAAYGHTINDLDADDFVFYEALMDDDGQTYRAPGIFTVRSSFERGFLRDGTRLRRGRGTREARARKERQACLVGPRGSLASRREPRGSSRMSQVCEAASSPRDSR